MTNGSAWCGLSHSPAGEMTDALLLVAWPYQQQVLTSFRYTQVSQVSNTMTLVTGINHTLPLFRHTHFLLRIQAKPT